MLGPVIIISVLVLVGLAGAGPVYVCGWPDGRISVTTVISPDIEGTLARMRAATTVPEASACWWTDSSSLPARDRDDPRMPGRTITQRHRWRALGQSVIADQTIMRAHRDAILREIRRALGPDRAAVVLATPVGDNILRAVRAEDWALARSLLRLAVTGAVLTLDEARAIRDVARDYEASLD